MKSHPPMEDYRKGPHQVLTLEAAEFIGRFMSHILPSGFYKIRHYGLLANANGIKRFPFKFND